MRGSVLVLGVACVVVAGCTSSDPFVGTFSGAGEASTGDANGASATTQSGTMSVAIAHGAGVDGGVSVDGGAAPYTVRVTAAFDGAPVGSVDCTLEGLFGSGPSVVLVAGQTCDAPVGGATATLTLFAGQATWDGASLHATLIWTLASGRTRWSVAATRQ